MQNSSSLSSLHARIETLKARQRERQSGLGRASTPLRLDDSESDGWLPPVAGRPRPLSASSVTSSPRLHHDVSDASERDAGASAAQQAMARASSMLSELRLGRVSSSFSDHDIGSSGKGSHVVGAGVGAAEYGAAPATGRPAPLLGSASIASLTRGAGNKGAATSPASLRYCESCVAPGPDPVGSAGSGGAGSAAAATGEFRASATVYCRNCGGWLCSQCDSQLHPISNALLRRHVRVPSDQVRPPVMCLKHRTDEATYFCLDCEVACVCSECVVHYDHKGHNVETLVKAVPHVRGRMAARASALQQRMDQWAAIQRLLQAQLQQLKASGETVKDSIRRAFSELHQALNRAQDELIGNLDAEIAQEQDQVSASVDQVAEHSTSLSATLDLLRDMTADPAVTEPARFLNAYVDRAPLLEQGAAAVESEPPEHLAAVPRQRRFVMDAASAEQFVEALKGLKFVVEESHVE